MAFVDRRELTADAALPGSVRDYVLLLKPRVMSLVVFTAFVGMVLAHGRLTPLLSAIALFAIAVGAGASGALNMWFDADIDRVMRRTRGRPVPAGRLAAGDALAVGLFLSGASVALLGLAANWLAAALLAFTIAFYVLVYTVWLKRRTPQNIVIGGVAGAFPPMIGWAAVTGGVSVEAAALFLIIFLWTPPHFWALALYRDGDYARAGVPMLPVVAGRPATRRQILLYTVVSAPAAVAPWYLGTAGAAYGVGAAVLAGLFILLGVRVLRDEGERAARQMFGFSILYLFLLFALMMVDGAHGPFG